MAEESSPDNFHGRFKTSKKIYRAANAGCWIFRFPEGAPQFRFSSCFVFAPRSKLRIMCHNYLRSRVYELMLTLVIAGNCVVLAIEGASSSDERPSFAKISDIVFVGLFLIEMCIKIIAFGFVMHPRAYLRAEWGSFEFVAALAGLIALIGDQSSVPVESVRFFRLLTTLRSIELFLTIMDIYANSMQAMWVSVKVVAPTSLLTCGVVAVAYALFHGPHGVLASSNGVASATDAAFLAVQQFMLDGLPEVKTLSPTISATALSTVVSLSGAAAVQMLVAFAWGAWRMTRREELITGSTRDIKTVFPDGNPFLIGCKKHEHATVSVDTSDGDAPLTGFRLLCKRAVGDSKSSLHGTKAPPLVLIASAVTFVNVIIMISRHEDEPEDLTTAAAVLDGMFAGVAGVEMLLSLVSCGVFGYFRSPPRLFDFLCLAEAIADMVLFHEFGSRALRPFNPVRILKLIKHVPLLERGLSAILDSLNTIIMTGLLYFGATVGGLLLFESSPLYGSFETASTTTWMMIANDRWGSAAKSVAESVEYRWALIFFIFVAGVMHFILLRYFLVTLLPRSLKVFHRTANHSSVGNVSPTSADASRLRQRRQKRLQLRRVEDEQGCTMEGSTVVRVNVGGDVMRILGDSRVHGQGSRPLLIQGKGSDFTRSGWLAARAVQKAAIEEEDPAQSPARFSRSVSTSAGALHASVSPSHEPIDEPMASASNSESREEIDVEEHEHGELTVLMEESLANQHSSAAVNDIEVIEPHEAVELQNRLKRQTTPAKPLFGFASSFVFVVTVLASSQTGLITSVVGIVFHVAAAVLIVHQKRTPEVYSHILFFLLDVVLWVMQAVHLAGLAMDSQWTVLAVVGSLRGLICCAVSRRLVLGVLQTTLFFVPLLVATLAFLASALYLWRSDGESLCTAAVEVSSVANETRRLLNVTSCRSGYGNAGQGLRSLVMTVAMDRSFESTFAAAQRGATESVIFVVVLLLIFCVLLCKLMCDVATSFARTAPGTEITELVDAVTDFTFVPRSPRKYAVRSDGVIRKLSYFPYHYEVRAVVALLAFFLQLWGVTESPLSDAMASLETLSLPLHFLLLFPILIAERGIPNVFVFCDFVAFGLGFLAIPMASQEDPAPWLYVVFHIRVVRLCRLLDFEGSRVLLIVLKNTLSRLAQLVAPFVGCSLMLGSVLHGVVPSVVDASPDAAVNLGYQLLIGSGWGDVIWMIEDTTDQVGVGIICGLFLLFLVLPLWGSALAIFLQHGAPVVEAMLGLQRVHYFQAFIAAWSKYDTASRGRVPMAKLSQMLANAAPPLGTYRVQEMPFVCFDAAVDPLTGEIALGDCLKAMASLIKHDALFKFNGVSWESVEASMWRRYPQLFAFPESRDYSEHVATFNVERWFMAREIQRVWRGFMVRSKSSWRPKTKRKAQKSRR